jgi:bacteriocin biosynthesis cyclodehydratase domain-containing protein
MLSAVKYATIPLPQKPRLAPWVTFVDLGNDRLQLRGAEFSYTLRHDLFIKTLEFIRPLLNGDHEVEEIASSGGETYLPTTITFLLKMLRANGLLQEGNVPPPAPLKSEDLNRHENFIQFLSHYVSNPVGSLALLKGAKVGVIGSHFLKISIQSSLSSVGVDSAPEIQTALDASSNNNGSSLTDAIKNLDYLIVCEENSDQNLFKKINSICLENDVRWIRVAIEGTMGLLGPTVIPHQSACYVCYERRIDSNISELENHIAYRNQLDCSETFPNEGLFPPLVSVIAGQVALEVVRLITSFAPPKTIGRFYEFNAISPTVIGHEIFRLPRCPACISQNPKMEAWDNTIFLSKKVS